MKRTYLKFYAKLVAALLSVMVAFTACGTPKSAQKVEETTENKDKSIKKDTIPTYRKGKFKGDEVIAMYGVRPERYEK